MLQTVCALSLVGGIILAVMTTTIAALTGASHAEEYSKSYSYSLIKTIGSDRTGPGEFNALTGLATDPAGNLYVVDSGNKRVQKFSNNGTFLAMWNIPDAASSSLVGIDVDSDGSLYVVDFQEFTIWMLSGNDTSLVSEFAQPSGDGSLRNPFDIAIDPVTNEVYVTAASDGIRKYASNGTLITQFNENHKDDARIKLLHTTGVDIDSNGNVYVLAADNPIEDADIVQVFSSDGTFIASWGGEPLKHPNDIGIDSSDTVFIRDSDSKIKVFTKDGTFLREWGSAGIENEQPSGSVGIAFDPNDDDLLYLSDPRNNLVQKYAKNGTYISSIGLASTAEGQFQAPYDVEFDSQGNMYVADLQNYRIQKFTANGTFATMWGSQCGLDTRFEGELCIDPNGPGGPQELGDGQFSSPTDLAIDSQDNVYVLDGSDNTRIQKFTSDGKFISKFGVLAQNKTDDDTTYVSIAGIVVDSKDNVYAAVSGAYPSIQKFAGNGTFIEGWDLHGPKTLLPPPPPDLSGILGDMTPEEYATTKPSIPLRITIDSSDNIYVYARVDTIWENYHIEKMSNNGTHLASWGQAGWCGGEFRDILGMAFDSEDNLFLLDWSSDRIVKFASDGTFVTLLYPEHIQGIDNLRVNAIAFDGADNLYLATGNTISIFAPSDSELPSSEQDEPDVDEAIEPAVQRHYVVPTKISEGVFTHIVSRSSTDVRLVCGSIDADQKYMRFELLNNDASKPNRIELMLPDEYISGIHQVRSDGNHELPFEARQPDDNDIALLAAHELSAHRDYTVVTFVAPENASFIDIYAAKVVPEFGSIPIFVMTAAATMILVVATRYRNMK